MDTVRLISRVFFRLVVPLLIIAAALLAGYHLLYTKPTAQRQRPAVQATLVDVTNLTYQAQAIRLKALGTVIPAQEITLYPQVSGKIIEVAPVLAPGGLFTNGQTMLQIDPVDYQLTIAQRESDVARAEKDYYVEMGEQKMGKYYWQLIQETGDTNALQRQLTLREPQLRSMQAAIDAAKAALEDAKLDLERTHIDAPFNALIRSEDVDVGKQVSSSTPLATLVGTDAYWVQAALGIDRLKWIFRDSRNTYDGVQVTVRYPNGDAGDTVWPATVRGLLGDLEEAGRMARILVEIRDPLGLQPEHEGRPPLLLGAIVEVLFTGRELQDVIVLPRELLHEDDTVWLYDPDGALRIQPVDVVWRELHHVLVRGGLSAGDTVVVSDLPSPVNGMALATSADYGVPGVQVADHGRTNETVRTD